MTNKQKISAAFFVCLTHVFFSFCQDPFFVEPISPEQINKLTQEQVRKKLFKTELIANKLINFIAQSALEPREYEVYLKRLDTIQSYIEQLRTRNEHFAYFTH